LDYIIGSTELAAKGQRRVLVIGFGLRFSNPGGNAAERGRLIAVDSTPHERLTWESGLV
jgi:hypothetical protein